MMNRALALFFEIDNIVEYRLDNFAGSRFTIYRARNTFGVLPSLDANLYFQYLIVP